MVISARLVPGKTHISYCHDKDLNFTFMLDSEIAKELIRKIED